MMDLKITYPHMEEPVGMEALVNKKFNAISRRLGASMAINDVHVIADVTQRKPDGRPNKFSVMIMVHSSRPKKRIVAKKTASDFKKALNESLNAIEKVLRRESELVERSRKTLGHSLKKVRDFKRALPLTEDESE